MSLDPLLTVPVAIQIHALAAFGAFILGLVQFAGIKGTTIHRLMGWLWVGLMTIVAATSFWIRELHLWGEWSPIHLLSIFTLACLPWLVVAARAHRVDTHRWVAVSLFGGALVVAGAFTFVPGRIMFEVVFG